MSDDSIDAIGSGNAAEALKMLAGSSHRARLSVGVINNMPDKALDATARQFGDLLRGTAQHFDMRIQMFSLPTISRQGDARNRVAADYLDFDRLQTMHMDALIVTGAPPGTGALPSEPFWPYFSALVDWAKTHTVSTLWSCLSAHAAVLHLDGIERRRLPRKLSGVFDVTTQPSHPLLTGLSSQIPMPQSRYNALDEIVLREAGYDILTRSDEVGADIFTKQTPSLFVFLQGHPEYDADTLAREYRRDVGRFAEGVNGAYPGLPQNYFRPEVEERLRALELQQHLTPSIVPDIVSGVSENAPWTANSRRFFRNWIAQVIALKAQRGGARSKVGLT